jgi:hypothetical protein
MMRLDQAVRLRTGPVTFLSTVLERAMSDLDSMGLSLMAVDHQEFLAINQRYQDRGWYALNDHYGHERFLGLAITHAGTEDVCAIVVSRPLDLGSRSLADAFADLSFVYPKGVPIGARDRFDGVPLPAYGITGNVSLIGGLWIDPRSSGRAGLGGSLLLSYITRAIYACTLGTENPDYCVCLVIDKLIRGREKGRSMLDRYGFRYVAQGPLWVNHYPTEDLQLNTSWADRPALLSVIEETSWVAGRVEFAKAA